MKLAHSTTLKWSRASQVYELPGMSMPGAKAHAIAQCDDATPW